MDFIENIPEKIVAETVAKYNEFAGENISDADAERIVIDVMAYRESLLRSAMNRAMRQNFVQTAQGTALDYWGELLGANRLSGQSDEAYRQAILVQNKSKGIGTRAYYTEKIKSLPGVADVLVLAKKDEDTLPPGVVKIVLIEKESPSNAPAFGKVSTPELVSSIQDMLTDGYSALIGDVFVFENAVPVEISGTISIRKNVGTTDAALMQSVNTQVDMYFGQLSCAFDSVFREADLVNQLMQATGIREVIRPVGIGNVNALTAKHFYGKGIITISIVS